MNALIYERYKKKPKHSKKTAAKSTKTVAEPRKKLFIISFSISFIVLSILLSLIFIYSKNHIPFKTVNTGVSQNIPSPTAEERTKNTADSSQSFNALITVVSSLDNKPSEFMLYRLDAENSRTVIMPLPKKLQVIYRGSKVSLDSVYKMNDVSVIRDAVSNNLSINIDYTFEIGSDNFIKIFDKVGGIYTDVPKSFEFQTAADSVPVILTEGRRQYVNGDKVYALIAADYTDDIKKLDIQADIMKAFVTSKFTGVYISDPWNYYGSVFNLVSTRFSMNDLLKKSELIKNLSGENTVVIPKAKYSHDSEGSGLYSISNPDVFSNYFK